MKPILAKRFLPLLASLLALLLAACGGSNPAQVSTTAGKAPANQQIFIEEEYGVSDIDSFDPALSPDAPSNTAIQMVFTGLVGLNDKLQIIPEIAQSYKVSPDGLTWTFTLKPNLHFSDGTPLTSADVAYSIDRALKPSLKSTVAPGYLNLIKDSAKRNTGKISTLIGDSLLTPNSQTIVITISTRAAYFLDALAYPCSFVVEKKLVEQYGDTNWTNHLESGGGDGPWMVSKYEHSKEITFVPNPYYYGPHPQLKEVIFPFYQDPETGYKAYQAGQLSMAVVPGPEVPQARDQYKDQYRLIPQLWIDWYAMNYLIKPFDNIKIRQAFALAINKTSIAHGIYHDTVVATNHIVPQGMPGYDPNLTGPDGVQGASGNAALAKQLLQQGMQEEGYTLSTLPAITMTGGSGGDPGLRSEFAAVQQMWKTVLGVNVKINDIDHNELITETDNAPHNPTGLQFWNLGWIADYPDPQDWTTLQFGNGSPYNLVNYGQNHATDATQQQALQQTMSQADAMQNQQERMTTYNQIEQHLVNDVAVLPMYQVSQAVLVKPCVTGLVLDSQLSTPPDSWGSVSISSNPTCSHFSS
jgi:oligopeptide transport system substrate-binding protein